MNIETKNAFDTGYGYRIQDAGYGDTRLQDTRLQDTEYKDTRYRDTGIKDTEFTTQ